MTLQGLPEIDPDATVIATTPADAEPAAARRARTLRRLATCVLVGVLVLGVASLLGVRKGVVRGQADGYELRVEYPRVTRPGLAVPFTVAVEHEGGFDGPVELAVDHHYLDLFDENAFHPDPDTSTADGKWLYLDFEPPDDGDTFEARLDTRTGPNEQWRRKGAVVLLVDGAPLIALEFTSWVMP